MYDIIGDVHGYASLLRKLFKSAGYRKSGSGFVHSGRKAVFVGDFVNRGPEIRECLQLIRSMTEEGNAMAVLGNHEVNAILSGLKRESKEPLLTAGGIRVASMEETLRQFKAYPEEWKGYRKWFRTLPLYLDLGAIRVVHACWKEENIGMIRTELQTGRIPRKVFRNLVLEPRSPLSQSILQTTRGIHHMIPSDLRIYDNRHRRHPFYRVRWWLEPRGLTFQEWSFESKFRLPSYTIPPEILPEQTEYPDGDPIVFFGHYCRGNGPFVIRGNLCCVDACVSGKGVLAAYRWEGEEVLDPAHLIFAGTK